MQKIFQDPRFTWEFGAGNTYPSVEEAEQAKADMLKQIEELHGKQSVFYRQLKQKKIVGSQEMLNDFSVLNDVANIYCHLKKKQKF